MRVQRVGLEHHGQVALGRADLGDVAAVQFDLATADFFEPGDQSQQGGLAATGRADEHHELAIADFQVDALDDLAAVEAFLQVVNLQVCHVRFLCCSSLFDRDAYFTAPNDRPRTNCFWLIQPKTRMGAQARVETAESLAQNSPSGLE